MLHVNQFPVPTRGDQDRAIKELIVGINLLNDKDRKKMYDRAVEMTDIQPPMNASNELHFTLKFQELLDHFAALFWCENFD